MESPTIFNTVSERIDFALRRAIEWKVVKKTGTFEATTADFERRKVQMGRFVKEVNMPVNLQSHVFTKEDLDQKDARLVPALETFNAVFSGPKRRRMMAKALRKSYLLWHRPIPVTFDNEEKYISRLKFVGPDFKNKEDFYLIFDCLTLLHHPDNPLEIKEGVFANLDFMLAGVDEVTGKTLMSKTDLDTRHPGMRQRIIAGFALELPKYELFRYALETVKVDSTIVLPDDFADGIEFDF